MAISLLSHSKIPNDLPIAVWATLSCYTRQSLKTPTMRRNGVHGPVQTDLDGAVAPVYSIQTDR